MIIGRVQERRTLSSVIERARDGHGGALVVRGEAGIGKTALLKDALANTEGVLTLEARGVQAERELAYAGLSQLLRGVLAALPLVPGVQRDALNGALGLTSSVTSEPFLVSAATLTLLSVAAEEQPLLAVVDDIQWLDVASARALAFAARRLDGERAALIFGLRTTERDDTFGDLREVLLDGLDVAATQAFVRQYAGRACPGPVAARAHALTGGNPLALRQLTETMTPEQLAGTEPLSGHMVVHGRISKTFGARLSSLPIDTQQVLWLASVSDSGDLNELGRVLRTRGLRLEALGPAEDAALVIVADGQMEFAHPLLRSVAYSMMTAAQRREAHTAVAGALDASADRGRRAWHLAAAALDPDESVAAALEAAAGEAQARAAPSAAARALTRAARLTPSRERRQARLLAAAQLHVLAGSTDVALRLLDEVLAADPGDAVLIADVTLARARIEAMRGSVAAVRDMLLAGADRVEPHDPVRAVAMRLEAGLALFMMGRPRDLQALAEKVWPAAQVMGGPAQAMASFLLGVSRALRGDPTAAAAMLGRARTPIKPGQLSIMGPLAATEATLMTWMGRFPEAQSALVELVAMARAEGAVRALPNLLAPLADTSFRLGEWRQADAYARESVELAEETGQANEVVRSSLVVALVAAGRGREDEARHYATPALAAAADRDLDSIEVMGAWILGALDVSLGRYESAIATLEPAGRLCIERGLEEPGVAPWAQELAEAYIRAGQREAAVSVLETLAQQAARTQQRLAHAAVERCRGLLADDDAFEPHFAAALRWHDGAMCPHERARTQLCLGERRRRARRAAESRLPLEDALSTFERLGADAWAERARGELGATGKHARRRVPETADALTAQEIRVATLAADGATTREIAGALFVSPKTVETHLGRVYRKLGVHSRVQLVHALEHQAVSGHPTI